jgi:hypothetical protein
MIGTQRARLIRRVADLLAEVESSGNGKLLREMSGHLRAQPER